MKSFKILSTLAILISFTSCGDSEKSSSPSPGVVVTVPGEVSALPGTGLFTDINTLRNTFASMSIDSGLGSSSLIYHTGTHYGATAQSSSGGFNFSFQGCFFGLFGDCTNSNNVEAQLNAILDEGRVLRYSDGLEKAISVVSNQFMYMPYHFDRSHVDYIAMLDLANLFSQSKLASVSIVMSDNTTVQGTLVEYFDDNFGIIGNIKRYILTDKLPLIANPIAIIDGATSPSVTGVLKQLGSNVQVKYIIVSEMTVTDYQGNRTTLSNRVIQL